MTEQSAREAANLADRLKGFLDVISLAAIAVFLGVAVWLAMWGEGPRGLRHLSIQSKIVLLDGFPFMFGCMLLIAPKLLTCSAPV